jgi:hypothetical protein
MVPDGNKPTYPCKGGAYRSAMGCRPGDRQARYCRVEKNGSDRIRGAVKNGFLPAEAEKEH